MRDDNIIFFACSELFSPKRIHFPRKTKAKRLTFCDQLHPVYRNMHAPEELIPTPCCSCSSQFYDDEEQLLEHRKRIVRSSWRAIQFALDERATKVFYDRLFDQHPSVRLMFKDDMNAQYKKLYAAVSLAVRCLDNLDTLLPTLKELGVRHASYGVVREHYDAVVDCFLWTLNTFIFTHMPVMLAMDYAFDVADSWEWVLLLIGSTMADAADTASTRSQTV